MARDVSSQFAPSWYSAFEGGHTQSREQRMRAFTRLWRAFMRARVFIATVLLALQVFMLVSQTGGPSWLVALCSAHLCAALVTPFLYPPTWPLVLLAAASYAVRMFGVEAIYHRYFSHRAFKCSRRVQFMLAVIASQCGQHGPLWWASVHRSHHQNVERPDDPISPRQHGLFQSHVGWVWCERYKDTDLDVVPDFAHYPEILWVNKHYTLLMLSGAFFIWLLATAGVFGATVTGGDGKDTIDVSADLYSAAADITTITDFVLGTDKLTLNDLGTEVFNATKVDISAATTLETALGIAIGNVDGSANAQISWFQYGGNTFIVDNQTAAAVVTDANATDIVVKLTGLIDLSTLTVADFTFA